MLTYQTDSVYTRLNAAEVHIWTVPLNVPDSDWKELAELLSDAETARAARFVFEKDRRSFAVCRGSLRQALAGYLGQPPRSLIFEYSEKGKPRLAAIQDLCFNVSHSGSLAVFAFTIGCELGVDLETIRPISEIINIARRCFCPEEVAELMSLPESARPEAFFRCWTRKEAFIKATGQGLSTPLDQFQVTFKEAENSRFIHIHHDAFRASQWTLQNLNPDAGYVGALAYNAPPRTLTLLSRGPNALRP